MKISELRTVVWAAAAGTLFAAACSATSNDPAASGGGSGGGGTSGTGGTGGSGAISVGGSGGGNIDTGVDDTGDPTDGACTTYTDKAGNPAVDIIWLVDNSCSMGDEIAKVRDQINSSFVPKISASPIDWQVIMVSARGTSSQKVCVDPPLAGASCGNNLPKFTHLDCEVQSSNSLQVAAYAYIGGGFPPVIPCNLAGGPWSKLARFEATKVFVEVTDDEADFPGWNAAGFENWMYNQAQPAGMFGTPSDPKWVFHSIIGADINNLSQTCSSVGTGDAGADSGTGNSAVNPGLQYQKLSQDTGGIVRSICESDWSDIFNTIAAGIVDKLSCELSVPKPADGGAIDPNKVNITFTGGDGGKEDILQDNNANCNEGADGWQWDSTQSKIYLCGPTCDKVKADDKGQIDVVIGCQTKTVPPPK
jgi:hypothetical protein